MFDIVELLISIAILLIGLAIYSIFKQKTNLDSFSSELIGVMEEAELLKNDLTILMENAIEISSTIVDEVDNKLSNNNTNKPTQDYNLSGIDINNLAKEYGLTIEQISSLLKALGYKVANFKEEKVDIESNLIMPKGNQFYPKSKSNFLTVINESDNIIVTEEKQENDILQEVISLANQGYNIKEIAKLLNRGQGEISLLLNLSKKSRVI